MDAKKLIQELQNLAKFEVNTTVKGLVTSVKNYNDNANKKGAQLGFDYYKNDQKFTSYVKVQGSKEEDLNKFLGENIIIKNVNIVKVDFDTYYNCEDKICISADPANYKKSA